MTMPDRAVVDERFWTPPNGRNTLYLTDANGKIYAQVRFECLTDNGEQWSAFLPLDHPDNYNQSKTEQEAKAWAETQVERLS